MRTLHFHQNLSATLGRKAVAVLVMSAVMAFNLGPLEAKAEETTQQTLEIYGGLIDADHPLNSPDPYTEVSTDEGLTWQPAYLVGQHPWGLVSGTNSWLNCVPSINSCAKARSDYRYRFFLAEGWRASNMSVNMKMDDYGWVSLNGNDISGLQAEQWNSGGPIDVDAMTKTGWNELRVILIDYGGAAGINYKISYNVISPYQIKVMEPGKPSTLDVLFDSEGGKETYEKQVYTLGGEPVALPAPTRDGYSFTGWAKKSVDGVVIGSATLIPEEDMTLHATWLADSHVVEFDSKSGSAVESGSFVTDGSIASAPSAPTREGYNFVGWSATDGGSAVEFPYSPGVISDITLYALWSFDDHTVTYDSKGGSSVTNGFFFTDGSLEIPFAPSRDGYAFLGWSATDGGEAITFPYSPGVYQDITLYALWSADSHTVTFDSKSGSAVSADSFVTDGSLAIPYDPTREGYAFLGWSDTDGGSPVSFPYTPGVTQDITLYALWSADSHTVTYDSKSGSAVASGTFLTDGSVTAPASPTRAGYTFLGWSATDGGAAITFPYSPGVITGITLYAKWSIDSHIVTFNSKNGSAVAAGSFVTAGSVEAPSAPTRVGHNFLGWSATDGGSAVTFPYSPGVTTDVTLYALWFEITAPSAPQNVTATAGNKTATVSWAVPTSNGGAAIISYLVTASTGQTCSVVILTCTFTGLPNKTAVTFTVVAINSAGNGTASTPSASITPFDPNDDVLPPDDDGTDAPKAIPSGGKFVQSNDPTLFFSWNKSTGKLLSNATGVYIGYIEAKITFTKSGKVYTCSTVFGDLKVLPQKTAAQKAAAMKPKTFKGTQFCISKTKMDSKSLAPKGGLTAANFKKIKSMNKTSAELAKEKAALTVLKGFTGVVQVDVVRYRAWPTTMLNFGDHTGKGGKIPAMIRNTKVNLG